jgi:phosphotransacetylase
MPADTLTQIKSRAASRQKKILLGDATDERMLRAARIATDTQIATIVLIGNKTEEVEDAAKTFGVSLDRIDIWPLETCPIIDELTDNYYERRRSKVADRDTAHSEIVNDLLLFGALNVEHGDADGIVAGSLSTTASVIRAAIRGIGLAQNIRSLSSMFLMDFPERHESFAFADCAGRHPKPRCTPTCRYRSFDRANIFTTDRTRAAGSDAIVFYERKR